MSSKIKAILFILVIILCTGCDQVTKEMARKQLMNNPEATYLHGTFRLMYVENTGAAYSMGDNLTGVAGYAFLIVFPLLLLTVILGYFIRNYQRISFPVAISLACVFAGGIGNLFDRFFNNRHVTDFMQITVGELHTGIFNFADVFITVGVISLVIFAWPRKGSEPQISKD